MSFLQGTFQSIALVQTIFTFVAVYSNTVQVLINLYIPISSLQMNSDFLFYNSPKSQYWRDAYAFH